MKRADAYGRLRFGRPIHAHNQRLAHVHEARLTMRGKENWTCEPRRPDLRSVHRHLFFCGMML